ncbi:NAD-dependent epimerase/dehydratase family protein [Catellatospora paridis]|uniref:NAD-dependent epimerase/dehydratase family protein n=1 Tax=Catellatospora paridis TaxID=1617086 RepID=UPI0012D3FE11|nr:NAD-dependent epimerase/dehydratase family protein [Catellatospora paridis]
MRERVRAQRGVGATVPAVTGTALVLGASGQVGTAVVAALANDGWQVSAGARRAAVWPDGVRGVQVDRDDDESLAAAVGGGFDVLVDCVAYTEAHGRQLAGLADRLGTAVVLSSFSVYADARGHSLDEATGPDDFPVLPLPVPEDQATVPAGPSTYSTSKVALENVLLDSALPVTVLRPGAIAGPGSVFPREWWFVKRALDFRPVQVLSHDGQSRFHTTTTANLAELIRLAAHRPGRRVLNAVDPQAVTVREIASTINGLLDHHPEEILIPGRDTMGIGDTPWSVPYPYVMDMTSAERLLGYRPVTDYLAALPALVEWIMETTRRVDWRDAFPVFLRACGEKAFDYASEDAWLAART